MLQSFRFLTILMTNWLTIFVQNDLKPEKNELYLLKLSKQKTEVIDLDNGFKEHFGTGMMNLIFAIFLCGLGSQYIDGRHLFSALWKILKCLKIVLPWFLINWLLVLFSQVSDTLGISAWFSLIFVFS